MICVNISKEDGLWWRIEFNSSLRINFELSETARRKVDGHHDPYDDNGVDQYGHADEENEYVEGNPRRSEQS